MIARPRDNAGRNKSRPSGWDEIALQGIEFYLLLSGLFEAKQN
jgi:hypothetical protein